MMIILTWANSSELILDIWTKYGAFTDTFKSLLPPHPFPHFSSLTKSQKIRRIAIMNVLKQYKCI